MERKEVIYVMIFTVTLLLVVVAGFFLGMQKGWNDCNAQCNEEFSKYDCHPRIVEFDEELMKQFQEQIKNEE